MENHAPERHHSLAAFAWQRLRRDKLALTGIGIIILAIIVAILGYVITPDSSPDADTHVDEIGIQRPGFKCTLIRLRKNVPEEDNNFFSRMIFGKKNDYEYRGILRYWFHGNDIVWKEFSDDTSKAKIWTYPLADAVYPINQAFPIVNDTVRGVVDFYAYGTTPKIHKTVAELQQEVLDNIIEKRYLLGTDNFGRDIMSRLMIGTRISLF